MDARPTPVIRYATVNSLARSEVGTRSPYLEMQARCAALARLSELANSPRGGLDEVVPVGGLGVVEEERR